MHTLMPGRYLLSRRGRDMLVAVASPRDRAPTSFDSYPRRVGAVRSDPHRLFDLTAQLATLLQDALGTAYRLDRELEAGGMSRLFLATDVKLNRQVVVKVLPPDLVSGTSIARFKREIELTVRLQHPHILPIITSGSYDDVLYYITPYMPGESLRERIAREGKLPLDDIRKVLRDVGGALAFAHQRGIAHRDVKPGNVLIAEGHAILADFGIARAVSATATPLTDSGVMPGTPAYMAPELPTDERADVYSLGVVGLEMLTGSVPGRPVSKREILTMRGSVRGDSRGDLRDLANLLSLSTSHSAAERPATARDFLQQLERDGSWRRTAALATTLGVAVVVAGAAWLHFRAAASELNPDLYAVVSLQANDSANATAVREMVSRFSDWRGPIASDLARDAQLVAPTSLSAAFTATRRSGARHLVVVDATPSRDSVTLRATLYDAAVEKPLKTRRSTYASLGSSSTLALRVLINGLLRDGAGLPWSDAADSTHADLAAWRAFDAAQGFVDTWQLSHAETELRRAVSADPRFALARLWLAQTLVWQDTARRAESAAEAKRAIEIVGGLRRTDSVKAAGILALANADFVNACAMFDSLVQQDSADYTAWIGLGDCEARDRTVLSSRVSPTGWMFRTSYEDASRAYRRAGQQKSTRSGSEFRGWLLGRLSRVLFVTTNWVREGRAIGRDTLVLGAFPFLDHDTIAFAPHPSSDFATRRGDPPQASIQAAVIRNRTVLRSWVEEWVRQTPGDPAAFDSLAVWAEISGGFANVNGRQLSTLELLDHARSLSVDSIQQARLAVAQVRTLFKDRRFEQAYAKADSLARVGAFRFNGVVSGFVGVAALLGRVQETIRLMSRARGDHGIRLSDGRRWEPPRVVLETLSPLVTYSAFGILPDSVRVFARRLTDLISTFAPDSMLALRIRTTAVGRALVNELPGEVGPPQYDAASGDEVIRIAASLTTGDTASARARLAQLRLIDKGRAPGNGVRAAFPIALMWLVLGDTAEATRDLDEVLRTLPALDPSSFADPNDVVLVVRSMALRANLAQNAGDRSVAREMASSVLALWRRADPELSAITKQMQTIAPARH